MRSMPTARWIGASATSICMVEQLGLAMIPRGRSRAASGLTSATTGGTSSSCRSAVELSITTAPTAANFGAYSLETLPPAENSAMSIPAGSNVARSSTTILRAPNSAFSPAERSLASRCSRSIGKSRSARIFSMVSPTAPVAPTTATFTVLLISIPGWLVEGVAGRRRRDVSATVAAGCNRAGATYAHCTGSGFSCRDARIDIADVTALGAMAQGLVHQHQRDHGLADRHGADADAGVVAAGGDHFDRPAIGVDAVDRQAQAGSGLECDRAAQRLPGAYAAQNAAGVVGGKALGRDRIAVCTAALRHRGESVADLD